MNRAAPLTGPPRRSPPQPNTAADAVAVADAVVSALSLCSAYLHRSNVKRRADAVRPPDYVVRGGAADGGAAEGAKRKETARKAPPAEERIDPAVVPVLAESAESAAARHREARRKRRRRRGLGSDDDALDDGDDDDDEAAEESAAALLNRRDALDPDTAHRQYQKRLAHAKAATGGAAISGVSAAAAAALAQQSLASTGEVASYVQRAQPSESAIDRLVTDAEAQAKRSSQSSRRRRFNEAEDVHYINERNRAFNHKLDRAFDAFTLEIAQNIERGTAL